METVIIPAANPNSLFGVHGLAVAMVCNLSTQRWAERQGQTGRQTDRQTDRQLNGGEA